MPDSALIRCMGHRSGSAVSALCETCKRLPRRPEEEQAPKWIDATAPCKAFIFMGRVPK